MPQYSHNRNNIQNKKTKIAATKYRLYQEIKCLYCRKQKLNEQLYRIHLECANNWNALKHVGVLNLLLCVSATILGHLQKASNLFDICSLCDSLCQSNK
jgi:hypothetical protein